VNSRQASRGPRVTSENHVPGVVLKQSVQGSAFKVKVKVQAGWRLRTLKTGHLESAVAEGLQGPRETKECA
jgi:hypothetical protein